MVTNNEKLQSLTDKERIDIINDYKDSVEDFGEDLKYITNKLGTDNLIVKKFENIVSAFSLLTDDEAVILHALMDDRW